MSAIKALAMREPEDFPLDFFSLNLEDYHMQYDGLSELPLDIQIPESDLVSDWLPCDSGIGCTPCPLSPSTVPLSPTTTPISPTYHDQKKSTPTFQAVEETFVDIKHFVGSQPPTPTSSKPVSGYTSPVVPKTPVFTPSVSPIGSYPSSPGYGRTSSPSNGVWTGKDGQQKQKIPRHKRKSHIDAEQRRRCKIQTAFDDLRGLVPKIEESSTKSGRQSKSSMLNKTVEFCRELRMDNKELQREANKVRQEMQSLTAKITEYQGQLPASGVEQVDQPASNKDTTQKMFDDYLKAKSLANWKFWIFGLLIRPLFETYNEMVVTESTEAFCRSVKSWVHEKLSLVSLRPAFLNTLCYLSRNTSIMSSPEKLPQEAIQAAINSTLNQDHHVSQSHSDDHDDSQAMEVS